MVLYLPASCSILVVDWSLPMPVNQTSLLPAILLVAGYSALWGLGMDKTNNTRTFQRFSSCLVSYVGSVWSTPCFLIHEFVLIIIILLLLR